jgi:SPP1 gp7 family putative phage head morphogenesis protein
MAITTFIPELWSARLLYALEKSHVATNLVNRNYAAYTIESVAGDVGFDLWDEQTVKRLIKDEPDLMPYYPAKRALNRGIDLAYGKRQISACVTSSILQGKSIKGIADDLQTRIPTMNRTSAIRTARTAVTGAQNAGRIDSYTAAKKMGIKLKKEWLATLDGRTRHSHAMLDGEQVDNEKKFSNGCMFPGDPNGPSAEVYNCRCTLIAAYVELGTGKYVSGGRPTPWVYQDEKGNWHRTHGQKAQPYLKPAVADHANTYRKIIEDEMKNG